jgi:hypothetical protein
MMRGATLGDERACWSAARLRLTSRDASVRRVIRSRGRQGPACDWSDEVVKIATTNVSASRTRHDNYRKAVFTARLLTRRNLELSYSRLPSRIWLEQRSGPKSAMRIVVGYEGFVNIEGVVRLAMVCSYSRPRSNRL